MKVNAHGAFLVGATILVLAAVVAGIAVVGSPQHARDRRLDEERIQDLRRLSLTLQVHYRREKSLPPSLETIQGEFGDLKPSHLADPETGVRYEYQARGKATYVLCAKFAAKAPEDTAIVWRHGVGRTCFTLNAARGDGWSAEDGPPPDIDIW